MKPILVWVQVVGEAIGPIFGAFLTQITHYVLYVSTITLLICAIFIGSSSPSLYVSRPEMAASRIRCQEELETLNKSREGVGFCRHQAHFLDSWAHCSCSFP
jgi:hypothetical protein